MGSTARFRGHGNIRRLGIKVYENPGLLTALKELLSTGYEWRVTSEIRSKAGLQNGCNENDSLWHSFISIGVRDGYFEVKHTNKPIHYMRLSDTDKVQRLVEWVEKE